MWAINHPRNTKNANPKAQTSTSHMHKKISMLPGEKVINPFKAHKGHHGLRINGERARSQFSRVVVVAFAFSLCAMGAINFMLFENIIDPNKAVRGTSDKAKVLEALQLPKLKKIFKAKTNEQREDIKRLRTEFTNLVKKLRPCSLPTDCEREKGRRLLIRNVIPENRYWCGKNIQGNGGIVIFDEYPSACLRNASYLFSWRPPSISGKGMPPIELYWDYSGVASDSNEERKTVPFECPISCRVERHAGWNVMPIISVKDTPFEIFATMEGEQYFPEATIDSQAYQNDRFYATTSFRSEVPMPYFSWAEYKINDVAVDFDTAIKGALFLANNCASLSDRESLVEALMQTQLRVDSPSGCMHNAEPPPGVDQSNTTQMQRKYLFYLAFENQRSDDYITEKLWGSLRAGTLPVYFGAPNVREHVPPRSVIFFDDFESPRDLSDYLIQLTKNKDLYNSYHKWREENLPESFLKKYEFTKTHSTCRICKFSYALMHGFGFDYRSQEIREPRVPHSTCRNKIGLVSHPLKEYWLSLSTGRPVKVESSVHEKRCSFDEKNRVLKIDHGTVTRMIYDQDGVTDFVIYGTFPNGYIMKLETPILGSNLTRLDPKEYWLQDSTSRITILLSEGIETSLSGDGTLNLSIDLPLQIRIISEDIDLFHEGAWKRRSYFGSVMKQDFSYPLQAFNIIDE